MADETFHSTYPRHYDIRTQDLLPWINSLIQFSFRYWMHLIALKEDVEVIV